jgi:hypothetical protein
MLTHVRNETGREELNEELENARVYVDIVVVDEPEQGEHQ